MRAPASVIIRSVGIHAPERRVTNEELSRTVDTSDEWIRTRSGIGERRIAGPGENPSDMGAKAAAQALERAGLRPEDIDLLVVATMTPDLPFPSTACLLQAKLGLRKDIPCFDIAAACSGSGIRRTRASTSAIWFVIPAFRNSCPRVAATPSSNSPCPMPARLRCRCRQPPSGRRAPCCSCAISRP